MKPVLAVGEILFDVFSDHEVLGGAPFNFFFHLHALGAPAAFASRVGTDDRARRILAVFERWNIDPSFLQTDDRHPTGTVSVTVDEQGSPDYVIHEDVAYDHLALDESMTTRALSAQMIYFGTLIQRSEPSRETVRGIMARKPAEIRGFYDINLRKNTWTKDVIVESLGWTDILKLNADELAFLADLVGLAGREADQVAALKDRFGIAWVTVTKGDQGSALYTEDAVIARPTSPPETMADSVGAGDAFASILALGHTRGWAPETILDRASAFARAICTVSGAIPDSPDFYTPFAAWIR